MLHLSCVCELKSLLLKVKEESEKVGSNPTLGKLRSWHLVPSLHGKQVGKLETNRLDSWAPESLQMVTAAMELEGACSLEEKLWPT